MTRQLLRRPFSWPLVIVSFFLPGAIAVAPVQAQQVREPGSIVHKIRKASERLEMTVNTSRRLELGKNIPEAQVNNPDILDLTPLSPQTIQISAKQPGVTQVNLFDEDNNIYTVEVIVYADAQELIVTLRTQFPDAALKVIPVGTSVLISGYIERPEDVDTIVKIAEQFYPNVINNMVVSGVQQVLLHVKVMEVSRTKLRTLGFDFAQISNANMGTMVRSGISGLLGVDDDGGLILTGNETFTAGIVNRGSAFLGILEALRQDNLAKVLAEPTLVTISGRPARFISGGEQPVPVPQALGTTTIDFKPWGTIVDFVPIVMGNGRIRLEVRPSVSEPDASQFAVVNNQTVIGYRKREVDTAVEMQAGQTLAIAGLVQTRTEAENKGVPWLSELPYIGVPFRHVRERKNDVELVIMVTPELVEAMDAHEVPQCGPGMRTTSPGDWDLFFKGHLEVPNCGPGGESTDYAQPRPSYSESGPEMLPPGGILLDEREEVVIPQSVDPTPHLEDSTFKRLRPPANSQNRQIPPKQLSRTPSRPARQDGAPGFIGPMGYDMVR